MVKRHSWARYQYDTFYRWMRRGVTPENIRVCTNCPEQVIRAADYSYQASDYMDGGWISNKRRERFYAIKCRILTREELPF